MGHPAMLEGPPLKIKIDGSPGFAWNRRHLRKDTKKRTEEPGEKANRRMSKEGCKQRTVEPKNVEYRMSKEGILSILKNPPYQ